MDDLIIKEGRNFCAAGVGGSSDGKKYEMMRERVKVHVRTLEKISSSNNEKIDSDSYLQNEIMNSLNNLNDICCNGSFSSNFNAIDHLSL